MRLVISHSDKAVRSWVVVTAIFSLTLIGINNSALSPLWSRQDPSQFADTFMNLVVELCNEYMYTTKMAAPAGRLTDDKYINWVKDTLALIYLKDGLEVFVDNQSAVFHSHLITTLGSRPCGTCSCRDLVKRKGQWTINCHVCQPWLTQIISKHKYRPLPVLAPGNTDPKLWTIKAWEVIKLYQTKGCQNHHSARDTDVAGILAVIGNCDHFHSFVSNLNLVDEQSLNDLQLQVTVLLKLLAKQFKQDRKTKTKETSILQAVIGVVADNMYNKDKMCEKSFVSAETWLDICKRMVRLRTKCLAVDLLTLTEAPETCDRLFYIDLRDVLMPPMTHKLVERAVLIQDFVTHSGKCKTETLNISLSDSSVLVVIGGLDEICDRKVSKLGKQIEACILTTPRPWKFEAMRPQLVDVGRTETMIIANVMLTLLITDYGDSQIKTCDAYIQDTTKTELHQSLHCIPLTPLTPYTKSFGNSQFDTYSKEIHYQIDCQEDYVIGLETKIISKTLLHSSLHCTLSLSRMSLSGFWISQYLQSFGDSVYSQSFTQNSSVCKKMFDNEDDVEIASSQKEENDTLPREEDEIPHIKEWCTPQRANNETPQIEESDNPDEIHRGNNAPPTLLPNNQADTVSPAHTRMTEDVQSLRQPRQANNPTLNSNTVVSLSKPEKLQKNNTNSDEETSDDHVRVLRNLTWLPSEQLPSPKINLTVALALDPIFQQLSRGNELGPRQTMKYELLRLCTLRNYPKEDKPFIIRIAGAGFYYAADGDEVVCYCCGIRRRDWTAECQPMRIHHRLSPNCSFLTRNAEVNVPVPPASPEVMARFAFLNNLIRDSAELNDDSGYDSDSLAMLAERQHARGNNNATQQTGPRLGTDSNSSSTVAIQQPRHPHYGVMSVRLATYTGWPEGNGQQPEVLADAGFYYVGLEDCVRCFQCGTGLRQWDREDDPWIEHARYTLTTPCQYLINKKGSEFVELVRMAIEISQNEPLTSHDPVAPSTDGEDQQQTEQAVTNGNINETEGNQTVHTSTGITQRTTDTASASTNTSGQPRSNTATTSMTKSSGSTGGKGRTTKEKATSKGKTHASDEQRTLLKENERLRDQTMCKICFERNVCIVFLPCGHLVTCAECAPSLRVCPICRKVVKGTVKTYMS